jgi:hypothetical protein
MPLVNPARGKATNASRLLRLAIAGCGIFGRSRVRKVIDG